MPFDLNTLGLLTLAQTNLGGMANSVSSDQLLSFLNEGKDEIWSILKQTNVELFTVPSQSTDSTKSYYFAPLSTTVREYQLPFELRDILFIEVLSPSGYEGTRFVRKAITHQDFRFARTSSTSFQAQGSNGPLTGVGDYYYDVLGKSTFILAQFPETTFTLQIWFIRALPDLLIGGTSPIDEIIFPFQKKIADYAVMKVRMRGDMDGFSQWKSQWRDDVVGVVQGSSRNSADPNYVQDFEG